MSTQSTISSGCEPDLQFHLYEEPCEEEGVYLELAGADLDYEARPGRLIVRIPLEIWEVIRERTPADFRFADWTDEQIDAFVEREVDDWIRECREERERAGPDVRAPVCLSYGAADAPRDQQIEAGREYFRELRDAQTQRKRRIERLRAEQRWSVPAAKPEPVLPK